IADFSLSGFGEKGKRAWEISAKSADIFSELIKLYDFVGTLYGQEKIILTAQRGNFNKLENRVHLEDDVVITTESGVRLTTDYLDWERNTARVSTKAPVDIEKDNMLISGVGIEGNTSLKEVDLEKEVKVEINDQRKIIITCSGPLNINYTDNVAVFNEQVFVDDGESQMYADLMEVFFDISQSDDSTASFGGRAGKVKKIIARGNVKIVREENVSFSNQAIYSADDATLTLTGKPKLIIYSTQEQDAPSGDKESI
ncbi:MAG: LPS export ABC transporter periplasmic protein LptC, partial [Candidatus Omnitrophota bacterium]